MSFSLEQVQLPVVSLGAQDDSALESADDWLDYFAAQITAMRASYPCEGIVRLSPNAALAVWGSVENFPSGLDPSFSSNLIATCGSDRGGIRVFHETDLTGVTVRLQ